MEDWYLSLDMYFMMGGTFSAFLYILTVYFECLVCLQSTSNSSSITLEMANSFLCAKFESGLSESCGECRGTDCKNPCVEYDNRDSDDDGNIFYNVFSI